LTGFWRVTEDGVAVAVKVQPKARRPSCGGLAQSAGGPRLRIAVREPAEDGRANRAACAALADALAVPAGAVSLAMGAGCREKLLRVAGDPDALAARLGEL
jgi:uncharacterized protein YggU (UPF0235/DUF167 family)